MKFTVLAYFLALIPTAFALPLDPRDPQGRFAAIGRAIASFSKDLATKSVSLSKKLHTRLV